MPTTEVNPAGVTALGKTKVAFFPTMVGAGPTVAEIAAGVNISFYIPGGEFPINPNQNTGNDVRLGSVQVYEVLGQKTYQIPDVSYIVDPQTPGTGTPAAVLVDGYTGFLAVRYGLLVPVDWTIAQKIDVYPITLGARAKGKTTQDEFGKFTVVQKIVVSGAAIFDFALAA